jgi:hypothetical protein
MMLILRALGRCVAAEALWFVVPVAGTFALAAVTSLDAVTSGRIGDAVSLVPLFFLLRWFGSGRFLFGLWLLFLSYGLCSSLVCMALAVIIYKGAPDLIAQYAGSAPHDRAAYLICAIALGLFALCFYALKSAEGRAAPRGGGGMSMMHSVDAFLLGAGMTAFGVWAAWMWREPMPLPALVNIIGYPNIVEIAELAAWSFWMIFASLLLYYGLTGK